MQGPHADQAEQPRALHAQRRDAGPHRHQRGRDGRRTAREATLHRPADRRRHLHPGDAQTLPDGRAHRTFHPRAHQLHQQFQQLLPRGRTRPSRRHDLPDDQPRLRLAFQGDARRRGNDHRHHRTRALHLLRAGRRHRPLPDPQRDTRGHRAGRVGRQRLLGRGRGVESRRQQGPPAPTHSRNIRIRQPTAVRRIAWPQRRVRDSRL